MAALLPNKDQSLLLDALARLTDLPWTASLVGSDTADPAYAAQLRDSVERWAWPGRVRIPGELRGPALEAEWDAADLSLLISRAETYGLVVTESLARGIPVVVREGTGAVEALAAGTLPGPPAAHPAPDAAGHRRPAAGRRRRARNGPRPAGGPAAPLADRPRAQGPLAGRGSGRPGPAARLGRHGPDRAGLLSTEPRTATADRTGMANRRAVDTADRDEAVGE